MITLSKRYQKKSYYSVSVCSTICYAYYIWCVWQHSLSNQQHCFKKALFVLTQPILVHPWKQTLYHRTVLVSSTKREKIQIETKITPKMLSVKQIELKITLKSNEGTLSCCWRSQFIFRLSLLHNSMFCFTFTYDRQICA